MGRAGTKELNGQRTRTRLRSDAENEKTPAVWWISTECAGMAFAKSASAPSEIPPMTRVQTVSVIGLAIAAVGTFLTARADALATHWQSLGPSVWGGTTDPLVRHNFTVGGFILLAFGLTL